MKTNSLCPYLFFGGWRAFQRLTFLVTITFDYLGTLTLGTYLLRLHIREV